MQFLKVYMRLATLYFVFILGLSAQGVNDRDHRQTVIATFAGSGTESIIAMATDAAGNIYVAGTTTSADFPVVNAAQAVSGGGGSDVFVAKVSPEGQVIWATFLGGAGEDKAFGLALDAQGKVYVAGSTTSADFPGTLPLVGAKAQTFLTKFDGDGRVQFSVVLGGELADRLTGFSVSPRGEAHLSGWTTSKMFPATPGAYRTQPSRQDDNGFAVKFAPSGQLIYITYLPGFSVAFPSVLFGPPPPDRAVVAVVHEASGSALVSGSIGQLARLSAEGSSVVALPTQIGQITVMTSDESGDIYVTGSYAGAGVVSSRCFLGYYYTLQNFFSHKYLPAGDAYVQKLKKTTLEPVYFKHLGGKCGSVAGSIFAGPGGEVTVGTVDGFGGFPMMNPISEIESVISAIPIGVVFQVSPDGTTILFSSRMSSAGPAISTADGSIYAFMASTYPDFVGPYGNPSHALVVRIPVPGPSALWVGNARNAFSGDDRYVSPGMVVRIDGRNMADETIDMGLNYSDPLPRILGGVQVLFGGRPAEMFRVAPDHVICVAPDTVAEGFATEIQVVKGDQASTAFLKSSRGRAAAVLTNSFPDLPDPVWNDRTVWLNVHEGIGTIRNEDGTLNTSSNPAPVGSTVTLFTLGLGGELAPGDRLGVVTNLPTFPPPTSRDWSPQTLQATVRSMPGFIRVLGALDVKIPSNYQSGAVEVAFGSSSVTFYVK